MYEGKSHTLFAKYAVPQMIGLLFNSVYMIVDGVFIGNRLGRDAMAAAAVSVPPAAWPGHGWPPRKGKSRQKRN